MPTTRLAKHYNYFRDYDPAKGGYIQSDPVGLGGGINTYGYVGANPAMSIDPRGLAGTVVTPTPAGGILGIIFGTPISNPFSSTNREWAGNAGNQIDDGLSALGSAIGNIGRPKNLEPLEERAYDRNCRNTGDPCSALKAATMQAITMAQLKMNNLLNDRLKMYGTDGWFNHQDDLRGKLNNIFAMISLGQKLGCDMTAETIAATTLMIPTAPK
ncbi:MAG TPA: RHS repeat-associated core domain-containing protein [Steroidobacteraceae bacterium]|jgi:uncharacterized protein RhaS with RHS repeats|nr:RHS repeat-associated core domain-containing protein [Steroidobacteraceae bacterium]